VERRKNMKKWALIYNPYFDTLGGGERYTLEIARVLSKSHRVVIAWNDKKLLEKCKARFGLKFENIVVESEPFKVIKGGSLLKKRQMMSDYDLAFFVSDGSLPFMFANKNYLHFQVPFHEHKFSLPDIFKFTQYRRIIVNSRFTEAVVRRVYKTINTRILYPPVTQMKPGDKTNMILNVGRFGSPTHPKKQELLIKAFLKLPEKIRKEWNLVLAGGYKNEEKYLEKLSKLSGRENILVITNPDFRQLKALYSQAKFYWHAAGAGESDNYPEKMEHFGITTVEAMSAGCVPVVINKGGQPEIVTELEGRLWNTQQELVDATLDLIKNESLTTELAKNAIEKAKVFSDGEFENTLNSILND
jgi:glycosyltransferase involved in cell wall biosynthesis